MGPWKIARCACGDPACRDWVVDPPLTKLTHQQAKRVATVLNDIVALKRQLSDALPNVKLVTAMARGGTLLDLGANIGEVAIKCAPLFDRVVAVEANAETCDELARRVSRAGLFGKVEIRNLAVTDRTGDEVFVSNPSPFAIGARVYRERQRSKPDDYYLSTTTVSFADLLAEVRPAFVKMDIEGSEWSILADAASLPLDCVDDMIVEFHTRENRPLRAVVDAIASTGFEIFDPEAFRKSVASSWSCVTGTFRRP